MKKNYYLFLFILCLIVFDNKKFNFVEINFTIFQVYIVPIKCLSYFIILMIDFMNFFEFYELL